jgi:hypothetical protein
MVAAHGGLRPTAAGRFSRRPVASAPPPAREPDQQLSLM